MRLAPPFAASLALADVLFTTGAAAPSIRWEPPVEIASGRGERGPWQQSESRYDYVDDPSVASASDGDTRSGDGGATFSPSLNLSRSVGGDGGVYVSWEVSRRANERPVALALAVSRDGGRRFGPPAEVPGSQSPPGGSNGSHQGQLMRKLAVDDDGGIALVNSTLVLGRASRVWLVRGSVR